MLKKLQKITCNHVWAIRNFLINEEKKLAKNSIVVDAGAGQCQYKQIFSRRHKYISVDLCVGDSNWDFSQIDIVAPLEKIPLWDNFADVILLNQVLEHIYNIKDVIKELARILKKNGIILGTVPQYSGEHQVPYDFFRFTRYSLEKIAEENGFKLIYIKPQGGFFICLGSLIQGSCTYFMTKNFYNKFFKYLWAPVVIFVGILSLLFDYFDKDKLTTLNYEFIFKKI